MCIWQVEEEDRKCEYCSYRGGCEVFEKVTPVEEAGSLYVGILSTLVGRNILERSRERVMVWARNMVCYRLSMDGYSLGLIGKFVGLDHATVIYAKKQVGNMLERPSMYPEETELWNKFTKLLSFNKN